MTTQTNTAPRPTYAPRVLIDAATAHARANNSDPFAYGRVMLHMRQGLEFPSDIKADADRLLAARTARAAS